MAEIIPIVDKNDEVIDYKDRCALAPGDIFRVAALWITNSKGQILLAKRLPTKKVHPDMWGPAAAGTVAQGESYEDNIIKETAEEIGLENIKPKIGPKRFIDGQYPYFLQYFLLSLDSDLEKFHIDNQEVAEIKWFDKPELLKMIAEKPDSFLPTTPLWIEELIK